MADQGDGKGGVGGDRVDPRVRLIRPRPRRWRPGRLSASMRGRSASGLGMLPVTHRDAGDEILVDAAVGGADLEDLAGLAEEMFTRVAPPGPGG